MMLRTSILIFIFLFSFHTVNAISASDGFNINLEIGEDATPPSTPSGLIASPASASQIELDWTASTDDVGLEGYQVFRDSIQIATTTLTSYSDTGLSASTSYAYFVRAFDALFNYSSSSNVATASTLATTPVATSSPSVSGGANILQLQQLDILPSIFSVAINWKTNLYAQYELRWGRTSSYELGFVANDLFKREHSTVITNLEPGTTYEYELIAYDRDGRKKVVSQGQFKTENEEDVSAPANVSALKAQKEGSDVLLSWKNPTDGDFSRVRIVRNYLFFPTDSQDGFIAYEGDAESFLDTTVGRSEGVMYYSVFSYDKNGNVSSGAIASVILNPNTYIDVPEDSVATSTASSSIDFSIDDVFFVQDGNSIYSKDGIFLLDTDKQFTVKILYEILPEHLKTIHVTFRHPLDTELFFTFLLRINKDKTAYEATVAPLRIPGSFPVSVTVYDFDTKRLAVVHGEVVAQTQEKAIERVVSTITRSDVLENIVKVFGILSFLIFLFLLWFFLYRRHASE